MSGLLGRCVFVLRVTLTRLSPSPYGFIYGPMPGPCVWGDGKRRDTVARLPVLYAFCVWFYPR